MINIIMLLLNPFKWDETWTPEVGGFDDNFTTSFTIYQADNTYIVEYFIPSQW